MRSSLRVNSRRTAAGRVKLGTAYLVWTLLSVHLLAWDSGYIREHYTKYEHRIPMRDGVRLFTIVYVPKDKSRDYPIILKRTPYSVRPYGLDNYLEEPGIQRRRYFQEGYIVVYQDVRGRYMSEGSFEQVRPYQPDKSDRSRIDETTDTYDTVEWLVENVPSNNGRVGISGISYPGFYASMGTIDAHPAVKATSPQAPVSKWMGGDDWYHNGAFLLAHAFAWLSSNGRVRSKPTSERPERFDYGTPDGYRFFLDVGPLAQINEKFLHHQVPFWDVLMRHGTWDDFWAARDILPHLRNIRPAVLVVGGWFDTENLYGALKAYKTIEANNPNSINMLVMGPWSYGQWNRNSGEKLGSIEFGSRTSEFYTEHVELPFFNYFLKDQGRLDLPEAVVFETGANTWRFLDSWPPHDLEYRNLYLHSGKQLSFSPPSDEDPYDEYVSDPEKPIPYTASSTQWYDPAFMLEDQRFASRRSDVLILQTPVLENDLTFAGPIIASLFVSTSGTDSDWVVKVVDVFPPDADEAGTDRDATLGGYQMLVRGDVLRGKFHNSLAEPQALVPNKETKIEFELQDVFHTFKKGHRIMVQIQSTWFPMIDLNPQRFVDIYQARKEDFQKATQRVFHSADFASHLKVGIYRRPAGVEQ